MLDAALNGTAREEPRPLGTNRKSRSVASAYRVSLARWPRALSRIDAATYFSLSPSKFDQLVKDGRMPKPVHIDGRVLWDIKSLDVAFDALSETLESNPWDNWGKAHQDQTPPRAARR